MLTESDKRNVKVAVESGFGRAQLLNAIIHRNVGMTPGQFRKQVTAEQKKV